MFVHEYLDTENNVKRFESLPICLATNWIMPGFVIYIETCVNGISNKRGFTTLGLFNNFVNNLIACGFDPNTARVELVTIDGELYPFTWHA